MTNHDFKSEFCSLFEVNSTTKIIVLALHKENMFTTTSKILFLFIFDVKSTTIIIVLALQSTTQKNHVVTKMRLHNSRVYTSHYGHHLGSMM